MSSPIEQLAQQQLPEQAQNYLAALPEAQQNQLAAQVLATMQEKDERVERALSRALDVVPAPLRRTVRKMLFS